MDPLCDGQNLDKTRLQDFPDSNPIHTSTKESTNIENIEYTTLNFGGPTTMKTISTQSSNIQTIQNEVIMDEKFNEFLHPNEHPKGFLDTT